MIHYFQVLILSFVHNNTIFNKHYKLNIYLITFVLRYSTMTSNISNVTSSKFTIKGFPSSISLLK